MAPPYKPKFVPKLNKQKIDIPRKEYLEKKYIDCGLIVLLIGIVGLILLLSIMSNLDILTVIVIFLLIIGAIMWGIGLIRSGKKRRKIDKEEYILKYIEYQKKNEKIREEYDTRLEGVIDENSKIRLT